MLPLLPDPGVVGFPAAGGSGFGIFFLFFFSSDGDGGYWTEFLFPLLLLCLLLDSYYCLFWDFLFIFVLLYFFLI